MKQLLFIIFITVSLNLSAQTNVHSISNFSFAGDTIKTITINAVQVNPFDSSVNIYVTLNGKNQYPRSLKYSVGYFQPFTSWAQLKQKAIVAISNGLNITILN